MAKNVVLGDLGMAGHTHLSSGSVQDQLGSVWGNLLRLAGQKSTSFFTFSLRYCRYCKLVNLSTLDMPGYAHSKWYYKYYL